MNKLLIVLICASACLSARVNATEEYPKEYFEKAENWNADGQYLLGYMFFSGRGMPLDHERAVIWFTKAAKKGHMRAQYDLANAYINGDGIDVNYQEAAKWLKKSAEQGYTEAQFNLGDCYYFGAGIKKNHAQAFAWWSMVSHTWGEGSIGNRELIMENMKARQRYDGKKMFEQRQRDIAIR